LFSRSSIVHILSNRILSVKQFLLVLFPFLPLMHQYHHLPLMLLILFPELLVSMLPMLSRMFAMLEQSLQLLALWQWPIS